MQVALAQAREGREHILGEMQKAMPHVKTELSDFAPRLITIKINPEKIRDVIGEGGAVIRALLDETGTQIFGAIVQVMPGKDGPLHISQIANV